MITKKQYNRKTPSIILEDCDCERDCSWQLNLVAPAKLLSASPHYARLCREFRGFVDRPHLTLAHVGANSSLKARWHCENCDHEWTAAVVSRSGGKRCRKCAMKEAGHEQALRKALGNNHPFIDRAIRVIKYPDIKPKDLPPNSNLAVLWNCRCGMEFPANFNHILAWGVTCSNCRTGNSSRFENEVTWLLKAYLPVLTIKNHYAKPEYKKFVDLYVEELDIAIELDTKFYHKNSIDNDVNMLTKLKPYYASVLRFRDQTIPYMRDGVTIAGEFNAQNWCDQISAHPLLNHYKVSLCKEQIIATLTSANMDWDSRVGVPERPADKLPNIEQAFIRNLSRPGRTLAYISAGSNDTAEFVCLEKNCDNVYPQRIVRWRDGIRCPKHKADHIRMGRLLGKGSSKLKDTHPDIFAELLRVVEEPDLPLDVVNTSSGLTCEFECSRCGHKWFTTPLSRTNIKTPSGCPECKKRRGNDRPVPAEKQLMIARPDLQTEYVRNISTPERPLERLSITAEDICEWSCRVGRHQNWFASPAQRLRLRKWRTCPGCQKEKL